MILTSYLKTGLETDPVWLGSGSLVIREEGEGPVVLGTPEGCGFGPGFCGTLNVPPMGLPLKASSSPILPGCCAALSLQVAPCAADLNSPRDWEPAGISSPAQPASGGAKFSEQQLPPSPEST